MSSLSPSPTDAHSLVGTVVSGRYRIHELLGEGGMGAVYRAEHIHMRKIVALKVLHRHMTANDEAVKRFEREAVAAARIEHVNVAQATDFGRLEDGAFYLVLEFADGTTLAEVLGSEGIIEPERAIGIAAQILSALQAAHTGGIVHRDLKPDNVILIPQEDGIERVKVLDFGIAKLESDGANLTQMGRVYGTPQYMAPEQAAGRAVDTRADLYALGLILYDMLAGQPAFASNDILALLTQQMTQAAPPLPDDVPPELSELVMALLAKDPDQRIQTATEARDRLLALEEAPTRQRGKRTTRNHVAREDRAAPADVGPLAPQSTGLREEGMKRVAAVIALLLRASGHAMLQLRRLPVAIRWLKGRLRPLTRQAPSLVQRLAMRLPPRARTHFSELSPAKAVAVLAALALIGLALLWGLIDFLFGGGSSAATASPQGSVSAVPATSVREHLTPAPKSKPPAKTDVEREKVIQEARRGSQAALYALEQSEAEKRSAREWLAIAQGRLKRKEFKRALDAYGKAIDKNADYASNRTMLSGIRYYASTESAHEAMLNFAAERLGTHGADLLFDVWSATSLKTDATQKAWTHLERAQERGSISPALKLALDVRTATSCEDYAKLLPPMVESGDHRSYRILHPLSKDTGCGARGKDDCFACLRQGASLQDALAATQQRAGPRYDLRRWR